MIDRFTFISEPVLLLKSNTHTHTDRHLEAGAAHVVTSSDTMSMNLNGDFDVLKLSSRFKLIHCVLHPTTLGFKTL